MKDNWTCPQWQAYCARLEPFEARKEALENEVPTEYKDRVLRHLQTVQAIKKFHERKKKESPRGGGLSKGDNYDLYRDTH